MYAATIISSKVVGIGLYETVFTYVYKDTKWGIIPVKTERRDTLTYRVYMYDGDVIVETRSLMTKEYGNNIPDSIRDALIEALKEGGYIHRTIL